MGDPADNRTELQRAIADRARAFAADHNGHRPRRYWQYAIGLVLAALLVGVLFLGFDTFLASMQQVVAIIAARPAPAEPLPVFIVPEATPQP